MVEPTGRRSTYDPELHTVFAPACNSCLAPLGLVKPAKEVSDIDYIMGTAGSTPRLIHGGGEGDAADAPRPAGRGAAPAAPPPPPPPAASSGPTGFQRASTNVQGLSISKPPYGVLTAVNLERGEISWSVPHGETPDATCETIRSSRASTFHGPARRERRCRRHEDARRRRRSTGDFAPGPAARRHASRLRQDQRHAKRAPCTFPRRRAVRR